MYLTNFVCVISRHYKVRTKAQEKKRLKMLTYLVYLKIIQVMSIIVGFNDKFGVVCYYLDIKEAE